MAEEELEDAESEGDEGEKEAPKKKGGKLKLIIIAVAALLVVLGGTGGGLFYLGFLDGLLGIEQEMVEEEEPEGDPNSLGAPVYHDIPEFIADLKTGACRAPLMKLSLTLQVDQADQPALAERQPKIIDRILKFLRDQERQALVGEAGAEYLREEIILIVDATIKPAKVQNVLFKSLVLQ